MISFTPAFHVRTRLGQVPAPMPPSPAPAPMAPPAPTAAPATLGGFLDTLKWAAIGFGAGALTGYALGRGVDSKAGPMTDSLLGGLGGVAASVLPRLFGAQ